MGDAAGIGPEIIVKTLSHKSVHDFCQPLVIGSPAVLADACRRFAPPKGPRLKVNRVETPQQAGARPDTLDVLAVSDLSPEAITFGTVERAAGAAAVAAIETGTHLAMSGALDALTTAPICKAALHRAGFTYPGHTEMLAAFTDTSHVVMMLCTPEALTVRQGTERPNAVRQRVPFSVSFVTNHIAVSEVSAHLSIERIVAVIRTTYQTLVRCGIPAPRLVVSGLNPHAGESGMFGTEEERLIQPAIAQARTCLGKVDGPLPADALFVRAGRGEWDAVIVMYHDQGNIPIKLLGFGDLVNVTLGLPIVRTSVDHGTAFDIAGKGIADETSLIGALRSAAQLAKI